VLRGEPVQGYEPEALANLDAEALRLRLKQTLAEREILLSQQPATDEEAWGPNEEGCLGLRILQNLEIHFANSPFAEVAGHAREKLQGMRLSQLERPEFTALEEQLRNIFHNKAEDSFVQELRAPDGRVLWIRWLFSLVENAQQSTGEILCAGHDITEAVLREDRLQKAEKLESLGTLTGIVAHDLNNIIAPVRLGVQMLHRSNKQSKDNDVLEMIETSIERAADLIRQMTVFSKGIQGERNRLQVPRLLEDIERVVRRTFPRTIHFTTQTSGDIPPIHANYTQIYQVLINLCLNSRDAMEGGGELTITAQEVRLSKEDAKEILQARAGGYVEIEVADTGSGIEASHLERVFQPYFTTKARGKGTGLGLSSVQQIVHDHEGFIQVRSTPGEGSTFTVYLPTKSVYKSEPAIEEESPRSAPASAILLVDDEPSLTEMLTAMLQTHGHRVVVRESGEAALAWLRENPQQVEAVIMDRMMPGIDGLEAAEEMRKLKPKLPILLMSGVSSPADIATETQVKGIAFLAKPFREEDLLRTLVPLLTRG